MTAPETTRVDSGGVALTVDVYGPSTGTPVVLLHGFPDTARLWSRQIGPLTDAGFRAIVPDQRGYGRSDKPPDVGAYSVVHLAADVDAILNGVGVDKAHLVGHDWGAAVAWTMATLAPQRVDRLVALSVGHPASFRAAGLQQREKAWHMLLFQFDDVAERWLSDDGWANFLDWSSHPDADAVIAELEASRSLTPALNWYRANVHPKTWLEPVRLPAVTVPTMGVWSTGDVALTEQQMTGSAEFISASWRYERLEGAGHWLQWEAADRLNALLVDFLGAS
jgi:pimeloyl-ACP methyl ester carboxylesterase